MKLLWDILRLSSSRRAALGLYVILTHDEHRARTSPLYALLHIGALPSTHYARENILLSRQSIFPFPLPSTFPPPPPSTSLLLLPPPPPPPPHPYHTHHNLPLCPLISPDCEYRTYISLVVYDEGPFSRLQGIGLYGIDDISSSVRWAQHQDREGSYCCPHGVWSEEESSDSSSGSSFTVSFMDQN